jgi:hypothetical protein
MRRYFRLSVLFILGAALLAPLPGCDRKGDVTDPNVESTPEPVRGVIATTSITGFQTDLWFAIPVDVLQRGVVDVTVDWTFDDTWMFVNFGDTECTSELRDGTCPFLISSETKDPKPRILLTDLLEPATYYLYLYNVPQVPGTDIGSDRTEAASIRFGLTTGFDPLGSQDETVLLGRPVIVSSPGR